MKEIFWYHSYVITDVHKYSFFPHTASLWNKLQEAIINHWIFLNLEYNTANYLTETHLDGSIFLHENPVFMSVQAMVIPLGSYHHDLNRGFLQRNMESSKSILQNSFAV